VQFAVALAGSAAVAAGDTGAGQTDWPVIAVVSAAGQYAVETAARADAVGAHRDVEAAVAELVTGPPHAQCVDYAVASAATEGSIFDLGSSPCSSSALRVNRHCGLRGLVGAGRTC